MSVVLRCPICGTTQGQVGECDACAEGEVRYFCTNHEERVWLDGPVCGRCGARFGDPPRKPRATIDPDVPASAPDFRPPPVRRAPPRRPPTPDVGARPSRRPEFEEVVEPEVLPRTKTLAEVFTEAIEERSRGRRDEAREMPRPEAPRRSGFPVAGCLGRIVALVFLLIAGVVIFLLMLFGEFLG